MKLDNCSAVITGASAGIGREFARQLALHAQRMVLVARRGDRLEELRLELQARNPALRIEIEVADLSVLEQVMELGRDVSKDKPVDFLINNAGLGDYGAVSTARPPTGARDRPLEVGERLGADVIARMRGPGAFQPLGHMREHVPEVVEAPLRLHAARVKQVHGGRIADDDEAGHRVVGDRVADPPLAPGGASGVPALDRVDAAVRFVHVPVEKVVRAGLNGIELDKALVIPGTFMKIGMALARLSPTVLMRLGWRFSQRRG